MATYPIQLQQHRTTGLWLARIPDLPGFVLFEKSQDALIDGLKAAFESYMRAAGTPVHDVEIVRDEKMEGYEPPAFLARASLDRVAA